MSSSILKEVVVFSACCIGNIFPADGFAYRQRLRGAVPQKDEVNTPANRASMTWSSIEAYESCIHGDPSPPPFASKVDLPSRISSSTARERYKSVRVPNPRFWDHPDELRHWDQDSVIGAPPGTRVGKEHPTTHFCNVSKPVDISHINIDMERDGRAIQEEKGISGVENDENGSGARVAGLLRKEDCMT